MYSENSTILCILVAIGQAGESSLALNLLCAKEQAKENSGTGQAFSSFSGSLWRGFLGIFFPLLFLPSFDCATVWKFWWGHHLYTSESCVWNCLPKTRTQTHMTRTLCCACLSLSHVQQRLKPAGPNEAQILGASQKTLVKDKEMGKKWIYLFKFREKHTPQTGWGIAEGRQVWHELWQLDFMGWVTSDANEMEGCSNYLGQG